MVYKYWSIWSVSILWVDFAKKFHDEVRRRAMKKSTKNILLRDLEAPLDPLWVILSRLKIYIYSSDSLTTI